MNIPPQEKLPYFSKQKQTPNLCLIDVKTNDSIDKVKQMLILLFAFPAIIFDSFRLQVFLVLVFPARTMEHRQQVLVLVFPAKKMCYKPDVAKLFATKSPLGKVRKGM